MDHSLINNWLEILREYGFELSSTSLIYQASALGAILIIAWLSHKLTGYILHNKITSLVLASKNQWDDELHKHDFFRRCAHAAPALIIYLLAPLALPAKSVILALVLKAAIVYLILSAVLACYAILNTCQDIYNTSSMARKASITGFIQVGKLLITIIAILMIISSLINKSPLLLLSGLGALTAVSMLVFRDAILGFVAGIQIAANRMVNNGDWIEMPEYGADGTVMAIGLTTVKVRNWDHTISMVPTYALITQPVKNWRGMEESRGRRIKRSISIDIQSVTFCDQPMLDSFSRIRFIQDYVQNKKQELSDFNQQQGISDQELINARRLTNIGTLRAYMEHYLRQHPMINQQLTLMVRQRPPTETGIPLEVYCFCTQKAWVEYEKIQSDIFDHFVAILPEFGLKAYQRISDQGSITGK